MSIQLQAFLRSRLFIVKMQEKQMCILACSHKLSNWSCAPVPALARPVDAALSVRQTPRPGLAAPPPNPIIVSARKSRHAISGISRNSGTHQRWLRPIHLLQLFHRLNEMRPPCYDHLDQGIRAARKKTAVSTFLWVAHQHRH